MQLFDCHNHIQDERLFPMLEKVMERAHLAGVAKMAIKGCREADWPRVADIINRYENAYLAFGLHPWFISGRSDQCFQTLENLLTSYPQASVGEIGIDHAVENRDESDQERVFLAQLEIARTYDRPVTIHCRQAWGRLIELLDQFGELPCGMLIHCFGSSAEVARELVKRGAYISFSGSITRPNAKKAGSAIRAVPDDRILIETDAPDIMPCNVDEASCLVADGQVLNEPANLRHVLAKAAGLRGVSEASLADLTFRNAERFFCFTARRTGVPPVSAERNGSADGGAAHGRDAHATTRRTGVPPVSAERNGGAVCGAAHGRDAHATTRRTGVPPVSVERSGGADGGADDAADGGAAHGRDAHATADREPTPTLPENYAKGTRLEEFHIRHGAHLPHWTREGGVYAVTFRLADSLPLSVLVSWKAERDNILGQTARRKGSLSTVEESRLRELYAEKVESYLDAGEGACWLRRNEIAEMVQGTLLHFDGERYELLAWCIMPNHVHVVLHPLEGFELSEILHSWKSYSAKLANKILGREGGFWQTEYYDHLIRDEEDFRHAVRYVMENPIKAGFPDWKWCGSK